MEKNSFKKSMALLLICLMTVSLFAGCAPKASAPEEGNAEPAEQVVEETKSGEVPTLIMTWWGNQVRNEGTTAALELYNKQNGGTAVARGEFYQWDDYWGKLSTSAAAKTMPDLVQMDYGYLKQYVESNQLLDLTPYIESGALDVSNVPENVLSMAKLGDGIYGVIGGMTSSGLFYNKTITDECGIDMKPNMTWDEFVEVAKTIHDKTGYRAQLNRDYMIEWARENDLVLTESKLPADSYEAYIPFFQRFEQGYTEGWMITPDMIAGRSLEEGPLVYGNSPETMAWCQMNGGSNLLAAFRGAAPEGANICVTTIPTNNPEKSNYLKPSMIFTVSTSSKHPDEAVDLLNFLINSEEAHDILMGERGVPASKAISDHIYGQLNENQKAFFTHVLDVIQPHSGPVDPPDAAGAMELRDKLEEIIDKIGYGKITSEEAAKEYWAAAEDVFNN